MKIFGFQIIGVCLSKNKIDARVIDFNHPSLNHALFWPKIKKKWRFNLLDGLFESNLSDEQITEKDKKNIREYLKTTYLINLSKENTFDKQDTLMKVNAYIIEHGLFTI